MKTNISYHGVLRVTHYDKHNHVLNTYTLFNTGQNPLFDILCNFLAYGYASDDGDNGCPGRLVLYKKVDVAYESVTHSILRSSISKDTRHTPAGEDPPIPCCRVEFNLPYNAILGASGEAYLLTDGMHYLTLYAKSYSNNAYNADKVYAEVKVEKIQIDNDISLKPGEYLSIAWELYFS